VTGAYRLWRFARRVLPAGRLTFGTEAPSCENAILVREPAEKARFGLRAAKEHKAVAKVPPEITITFLCYCCTNLTMDGAERLLPAWRQF
jgi:hypothetical protein